MAGIIYELKDVLEEQKECYEGLCTLATYKTEAVIEKNIEFLTEIVEREEEFVGRIRVLDAKRESLMNDVAVVTGLKIGELTLTQIIDKVGKDLEVSQDLMICREVILNLLKKLKEQNEVNRQILGQSLEFVDFTLNAIKSTQYTQASISYVKPGVDQKLESVSMFDQRQ